MTASQAGAPPDEPGSSMTPSYVLVLVIEAVVLAILYWVGRHFA